MKFLRSRFAKVVFCGLLGLGTMGGAQIRPEELDDLLRQMNDAKVTQIMAADRDEGDEPVNRVEGEDGPVYCALRRT